MYKKYILSIIFFLIRIIFCENATSIDSTAYHHTINPQLIKENLSDDDKIHKEIVFLNSGNATIQKYRINALNNDKTTPVDFHIGILLPISTKLKKASTIGYNISVSTSIPLKFKMFNKEIENSIYIDQSTFGSNISLTSILFKNNISFKDISLNLSTGSGFTHTNRNYFTNSLDISYKFPNKNFNLFINLNFQSSWNSFSLINNILGINVKYSRLFKF